MSDSAEAATAQSSPAAGAAAIARAFPPSLPLFVLTAVDPIFGEAVTAAHVDTLVARDAAAITFAPLPSTVHPSRRRPQRASDVLLLPAHATLSYLRTYPIPAGRDHEVPLRQFLRFFLLSYRTGTLGANPDFIRKVHGQAQAPPPGSHARPVMIIEAPTVAVRLATTAGTNATGTAAADRAATPTAARTGEASGDG